MATKKTDSVVVELSQHVVQLANRIAQIQADMGALWGGAVAQQGALEARMRKLEDMLSARPEPQAATAGDVYNITVSEGGTINFATRS